MSGGHFGYSYYEIMKFADELENEIKINKQEFPNNVIEKLSDILKQCRNTAKLMREVDLLYSCDNSDESFMRNIKNENFFNK